MKELIAGNELQHQGLEKQMCDMEDHLISIRDLAPKEVHQSPPTGVGVWC